MGSSETPRERDWSPNFGHLAPRNYEWACVEKTDARWCYMAILPGGDRAERVVQMDRRPGVGEERWCVWRWSCGRDRDTGGWLYTGQAGIAWDAALMGRGPEGPTSRDRANDSEWAACEALSMAWDLAIDLAREALDAPHHVDVNALSG